MKDLRILWWLFAFRGALALLFGALLFFSVGLLGTLFFDPVMLVALSLLLGFFVLANGLLLGVGAVFSFEHHRHPWWMLLTEGIIAIALGTYIAISLRVTPHSLAFLAGLHALTRVLFQLHLTLKLRQDRPYAAPLLLSALLSAAMVFLFFTHREDSVRSIATWLSAYEIVYSLLVLLFAAGLRRQPVTAFSSVAV